MTGQGGGRKKVLGRLCGLHCLGLHITRVQPALACPQVDVQSSFHSVICTASFNHEMSNENQTRGSESFSNFLGNVFEGGNPPGKRGELKVAMEGNGNLK